MDIPDRPRIALGICLGIVAAVVVLAVVLVHGSAGEKTSVARESTAGPPPVSLQTSPAVLGQVEASGPVAHRQAEHVDAKAEISHCPVHVTALCSVEGVPLSGMEVLVRLAPEDHRLSRAYRDDIDLYHGEVPDAARASALLQEANESSDPPLLATTNANGGAVFNAPVLLPLLVSARDPLFGNESRTRYFLAELTDEQIDVELEVPPPGRIEVTVLGEDASPRPGVRVWVSHVDQIVRPQDSNTDQDGKAVFAGLPFGTYEVSALDPQRKRSREITREITITRGSVKVSLQLEFQRTVTIEGVLLDPLGQPMANALMEASSHDPSHGSVTYTTDEAGSFAIPTAWNEVYRLDVITVPFPAEFHEARELDHPDRPDRPEWWIAPSLDDVKGGTKGIILRYELGASLTGRALGPFAAAPRGLAVLVSLVDRSAREYEFAGDPGAPPERVPSKAQPRSFADPWPHQVVSWNVTFIRPPPGRFAFGHLPPGRYSLILKDEEDHMAIHLLDVPAGSTDLGDVSLHKAGTVELAALGHAEQGGLKIYLDDTLVIEDDDLLPPELSLPPGRYRLEIKLPGQPPLRSRSFQVVSGQSVQPAWQ